MVECARVSGGFHVATLLCHHGVHFNVHQIKGTNSKHEDIHSYIHNMYIQARDNRIKNQSGNDSLKYTWNVAHIS